MKPLPYPPVRSKPIDEQGYFTSPMVQWLREVYDRIGGSNAEPVGADQDLAAYENGIGSSDWRRQSQETTDQNAMQTDGGSAFLKTAKQIEDRIEHPTPTGKAPDSQKLDGKPASYYAPSGAAPSAHQFDGAIHTVSGLTTGHFLKALSATTFGFVAHGLTYSDVGALAAGGTAADSDKLDGQHGSYYQVAITATPAIGLDAKTDSQKITDIIACLRAQGILGPNA